MKDAQTQERIRSRHERLLRKRETFLGICRSNRGFLAEKLGHVICDRPQLGPFDISNIVIGEIKLLCPDVEQLKKRLAEVIITMANETTREQVEQAFPAKGIS
jgi:hypothetical protein